MEIFPVSMIFCKVLKDFEGFKWVSRHDQIISDTFVNYKLSLILNPNDCVAFLFEIENDNTQSVKGFGAKNYQCNPFFFAFTKNDIDENPFFTAQKQKWFFSENESNNCHTLYVKYDPFKW